MSNLKTLEELKRGIAEKAVKQRMLVFGGNVTAVAKSLGVSRKHIYAILESSRK